MPILAGPSTPTVTETATSGGVTITVTSEGDSARMAIDLEGGPVGEPVYVLRRDRNGAALVRETYAGTVLWVAGTPTSVGTLYDYEARQGLETDYIVTDLDGAPLVAVRVTIPRWGTWLKSPGYPHLNLACYWKLDSDYQRAGRVSLLQPRGAKFPIALSDRRGGPSGTIHLLTMTDEDARSMTSLLNSGQPLMVDVPDAYGVPVRYISVNDVTGARAVNNIAEQARVWTLQIVEIAAPVGLPAGQDFTYEGLAALADSYIALAASFATYDDMALGLGS